MKHYTAFLVSSLAALTLIPALAEANSGDISGGAAIGADYAVTHSAPTNGLIVEGNVGIGTFAPDALLSLGGQAAQVIDMVRETTAATTGNDLTVKAGGAVSGGTNLNGGNLNLSSGLSTGTGISGINFKVYEAGSSGTADNSSTTAMVITGAGIVGIGTQTPSTPLDVYGTGATSDIYGLFESNSHTGLRIKAASTSVFTFQQFFQGTQGSWEMGSDTSSKFYIHNATNSGSSGSQLYINRSSGVVGMGTNSPRGGSTLDVNGKIYVATFAANSSTTVCQNANVLSTCTSARRYKKHIKPSEPGLKEVLAMKPVTFDLKDHKDNWEKHDFGFIA